MTDYMNVDRQALQYVQYFNLEFKQAGRAQAQQRGAREDSTDKNCPLPLTLFRTLVGHARTHYPIAHTSPSNTLLHLMMLHITSVLSTPEKQLICIPERSWLRASAYKSKPYFPDGLVHHMLIRADNDVAASILSNPIDCMERQRHGEAWMRKIETAHIFEAKTNEGYNASRDFVITHLKHWYWVTGQAHVRAAVTYGQEWQFVIYHAPQIGRRDCIQTLCHSQSGVKPDDVDLILGLLLDMVENTNQEKPQYFQVKMGR